MSGVRKIGTVTLGGVTYDLAVNGKAVLALEEEDLYGRPSAQEVKLCEAAAESGDSRWSTFAQELLDALAATMKERDAALARVQKEGD